MAAEHEHEGKEEGEHLPMPSEEEVAAEHPDLQHEEPEHPTPGGMEEAKAGEGEEQEPGELPEELPNGGAEPLPDAVAQGEGREEGF